MEGMYYLQGRWPIGLWKRPSSSVDDVCLTLMSISRSMGIRGHIPDLAILSMKYQEDSWRMEYGKFFLVREGACTERGESEDF